jgi:biotin carboxylase
VHGLISPGTDLPLPLAARVAERHNLPHPLTPAAAQIAASKVKQRECLAEAGVPHARSRVCATLAEARAAAGELGFPCVLKPPDRQGQRGLGVAESESELADAFDEALEAARASVVLVEELLRGPELTVNAFSVEGRFHPLTVTDRLLAAPPAFGVALAHVWPSELSSTVVSEAVEVARAAAAAAGVNDGPTYTQVLATPEGPVLGELAARLGGGHDAELCRAALGVDLNGLAIAAALGDEVPSNSLLQGIKGGETGGACIVFLVPPEGRLEEVEGVAEAEREEGIVWVRIYREPGHVFGSLRRGSDRAGAVLAVGESRKQAMARAERAVGRVRFHTVASHAPVKP